MPRPRLRTSRRPADPGFFDEGFRLVVDAPAGTSAQGVNIQVSGLGERFGGPAPGPNVGRFYRTRRQRDFVFHRPGVAKHFLEIVGSVVAQDATAARSPATASSNGTIPASSAPLSTQSIMPVR